MPDVPTIVLDASVAAKWHLRDEELVGEALGLRDDYAEGRLSVAMPDYARYEVASIFSMAQQRGRISSAVAQNAVGDFELLGFQFYADQALIVHALRLVESLACSFYDALNVALAEELGTLLVTADLRLVHRVAGKTSCVTWLGDYYR